QAGLAQLVRLADGCIGKLRASGEGGRGSAEAAEAFRAAVAQGAVQRFAFALSQQPFQARGGFTEMLDGLLEQLRQQARQGGSGATATVVEAIAAVLEARRLAQGNGNQKVGSV